MPIYTCREESGGHGLFTQSFVYPGSIGCFGGDIAGSIEIDIVFLAIARYRRAPEIPLLRDIVGESSSGDAGEYRTEMIEVPAGEITLGLSSRSGKFGWDNEFEARVVEVPGFEIDRYQVTNGQFLEFIVARGSWALQQRVAGQRRTLADLR